MPHMHKNYSNEIVDVLVELIKDVSTEGVNYQKELESEPTVYDSKEVVNVDLKPYLVRWLDLTRQDPLSLIIAASYIDKFIAHTNTLITDYNKHRILLTSLVVAAKTTDDQPLTNSLFAKIGGVTVAELNRLERTFLTDIEWETYVSRGTFAKYYQFFSTFATKKTVST
eukprot:TRINITY_DN23160_c0_g1_i1.p1 TRINITY_DN23160_c0_g1~~TRINITY_DN23160_c0_g1_i1.p1  ORF type:complete len:169 (+),score=28.54 TRINITY_DN23160_c0_g1_i1:56-562(+)